MKFFINYNHQEFQTVSNFFLIFDFNYKYFLLYIKTIHSPYEWKKNGVRQTKGNRNKESSQTTLEAETDEARSKDLKMQVTENNEISNIEKSLFYTT